MIAKPLLSVEFTDRDSVLRRKNQLTIYRDTMAMIAQLKDLIERLEDEYGIDGESQVDDEDQRLLMEATVLLKRSTTN